jgi:hypothetical protein
MFPKPDLLGAKECFGLHGLGCLDQILNEKFGDDVPLIGEHLGTSNRLQIRTSPDSDTRWSQMDL